MERYGFPPLKDYLVQELATLQHLQCSTSLRSACPQSSGSLSKALGVVRTYAEKQKKRKVWNTGSVEFQLSLEFETVLDGKSHWVKLYSCVGFRDGKLSKFSQAIEVFGAKGLDTEGSIVRRIHFDVALPNEPNKKYHPLYHVQVGGESCDNIRVLDESKLSYPRIPYRPLSLALFLDMSIRELAPKQLKSFVNESAWQGIVRSNEELMIYPFWNKIREQFEKNSGFVLSDIYYEGL